MVDIDPVTSPTNIVQYITNVELVCEKSNRSLFFKVYRKIPTLRSTIQLETWQASFPTGTVGPRVGIFLSTLNSNDRLYLSHIPCINRLER